MSGASRLTPAQQADAAARRRHGRPDKAAMSSEERRRLGLMDRGQAAEHEHLASVPCTRLADRSQGPDPDDIWAAAMSEAEVLTAWQRVLKAGHWDCGGWTADGRDGVLVCACGTVLPEPEGATA